MTPSLPVSVVIVSRKRPEALRRAVLAVSQLRYAPFELVVVADQAGRAALRTLPQAAAAKLVENDLPGVAAARNLGIAAAAGEIIAFLDDDAVPEPSWLTHLAAPFTHDEVVASGGFVRGRNGISWQWQGRTVDRYGQTENLEFAQDGPRFLRGRPGLAIKTEGTNMALRRTVLQELGGFDPVYGYFLDETDLNMRLAARHAVTALVPLAQVHHGFEANDARWADRTPRDLTAIGTSWAAFLHRYCPRADQAAAWARIVGEERRRLLGFMVRGQIEPRDVRRHLAQLQAGFAAKPGVVARTRPWEEVDPADFQPVPVSQAGSVLMAGRIWSLKNLRRDAMKAVQNGRIVTVICLSPTTLFHRIRFTRDGVWEQFGGIFGKSDRSERWFKLHSFKQRVAKEADRLRLVRLLDKVEQ